MFDKSLPIDVKELAYVAERMNLCFVTQALRGIAYPPRNGYRKNWNIRVKVKVPRNAASLQRYGCVWDELHGISSKSQNRNEGKK